MTETTPQIYWTNPDRKTATKVMVIISKKTGLLRCVHDHEHDSTYETFEKNAHPGEQVLYITHEEYDKFAEQHLDNFKDFIAQKAGFKERPDESQHRYAHVDPDGNLVNVLIGDKTCGDNLDFLGKGHKMIQHPEVQMHWIYKNKKLVDPTLKDNK